MSKRRRARILEILADVIQGEEVALIEQFLDDSIEAVRLNAARAVLNRGIPVQRERAFKVALRLLDSLDRNVRAGSEDILLEHFGVGADLVAEEIRQRQLAAESDRQFFPKESILRIRKNGRQSAEAQP